MGDGRRGVAPCGHVGEAVIGHYYQCAQCDAPSDGVPELDLEDDVDFSDFDPDKTQPFCAHCGSGRVRIYPGMTDGSGRQLWHCDNCMRSFMS
jgi:hypothetical protein